MTASLNFQPNDSGVLPSGLADHQGTHKLLLALQNWLDGAEPLSIEDDTRLFNLSGMLLARLTEEAMSSGRHRSEARRNAARALLSRARTQEALRTLSEAEALARQDVPAKPDDAPEEQKKPAPAALRTVIGQHLVLKQSRKDACELDLRDYARRWGGKTLLGPGTRAEVVAELYSALVQQRHLPPHPRDAWPASLMEHLLMHALFQDPIPDLRADQRSLIKTEAERQGLDVRRGLERLMPDLLRAWARQAG